MAETILRGADAACNPSASSIHNEYVGPAGVTETAVRVSMPVAVSRPHRGRGKSLGTDDWGLRRGVGGLTGDFNLRIRTADGASIADLRRDRKLRRAGVYVAFWNEGDAAAVYVGQAGENVPTRLRAPTLAYPRRVDRIVVATERDDAFGAEDVKVLERQVHLLIAERMNVRLVNDLPKGAVVASERFAMLHRAAVGLVAALARAGLVGGEDHRWSNMGVRVAVPHHLRPPAFSEGRHFRLARPDIEAHLVEECGVFVLLAGSDVRVRSRWGNTPRNVLRQEAAHSGLLAPQSSQLWRLRRSIRFTSASAAARFVLATAAGRPDAWVAVDDDGPGVPSRVAGLGRRSVAKVGGGDA